jgi:hypothetical protein
MEEALKYLPLITICGTAIAFVAGFFKWIDQRSREQEQKLYEAFHKMVCIASGINEAGNTVKMSQQIAAIYQLQAYKQYAFASIPVLELMQFDYATQEDSRKDFIITALRKTFEVLSEH